MKEIQVAAGQRTRIIRRQFSSLITTYRFDVVPINATENVAGVVEIQGSDWIFPKPVQRAPLQATNSVTAGAWDTFFSVYVTPEVDVVISLPSPSLGKALWMIGAVLGLAIVIVVAIAFMLLTS